MPRGGRRLTSFKPSLSGLDPTFVSPAAIWISPGPTLGIASRLRNRVASETLRTKIGRNHLRAIKTQKQVSYGFSHSQREQTPPPVFVTVVKHMASLAKRLQISHPVVGGIMVKMRRRQHYPGGANSEVVANSSSKAASTSIPPCPLVFIPPSTVA
jgi:hypothetical protein